MAVSVSSASTEAVVARSSVTRDSAARACRSSRTRAPLTFCSRWPWRSSCRRRISSRSRRRGWAITVRSASSVARSAFSSAALASSTAPAASATMVARAATPSGTRTLSSAAERSLAPAPSVRAAASRRPSSSITGISTSISEASAVSCSTRAVSSARSSGVAQASVASRPSRAPARAIDSVARNRAALPICR